MKKHLDDNMLKKIKKTFLFLLVVIVISLVIRIGIGEPCHVPSPSMEPTIMTGDWLWIDKLSYGGLLPSRWAEIPLVNIFTWIASLREADKKNDWGYHRVPGIKEIEEGDIVVFKSTENPNILLVKRLVAILYAGDTLNITDFNYDHYRSVMELEKNRTDVADDPAFMSDSAFTVVLQNNYYYMLGDNADNSRDSRYFGFVPEEYIVGKVSLVLFSWDKALENRVKFRPKRWFKLIG